MKKSKKIKVILTLLIISLVFLSPGSGQVAAAESQVVSSISTSQKVIALTFDDGYYEGTKEILSIVDSYGIKVSFFLLGSAAEYRPDLVQEIDASGHFIGNHSYNHPYLTSLSEADVIDQLQRTDNIIQQITGKETMPYFRPPYGDYNSSVLQTAGNAGFAHTIYWSIDSADYSYNSAEDITARVLDNAAPGAIVLLHAGIIGINTAAALPTIITSLQDQGYTFVTIPELLKIGGIVSGTSPTVSITSPSTGLSTQSGTSITFNATSSDNEDSNLNPKIQWTSNLDGFIGTSSSFSTDQLSVGTHTITAVVTDSGGLSASDSIVVVINALVPNTAPTVSITSPNNGLSVVSGTNITFSAEANDDQDGPLSGSVRWYSSIDGYFTTGNGINVNWLSVGSHIITATITDSGGLSTSTTITVNITAPVTNQPTNTAPTVSITSPNNGLTVVSGTNITFSAEANDDQDGPLSGSVIWYSSIDGYFTTGNGINVNWLSVGNHTITATITDSGGLSTSTTINVNITAPVTNQPTNTAPTISIIGPPNGSQFETGTSITFSSNATDTEDGSLAYATIWTSNLEGGYFTTGTSINVNWLSVGTHTITATVTDSGGLKASASIVITITAKEVTILDNETPLSDGSTTTTSSAPVSNATIDSWPTLRYGSVGTAVKQLQQMLTYHGFATTSDGEFGPRTLSSVKSFQSSKGLTADGIVGSMTKDKLKTLSTTTYVAPAPTTSTTTTSSPTTTTSSAPVSNATIDSWPTLRYGSVGTAVKQLQQMLNYYGYSIGVDGQYGPQTYNAVKSFQSSRGLTADGIVGSMTKAKLKT